MVGGGGRNSSLWWRRLDGVREGVGVGLGRWFDENVRRFVGNGRGTFSWTDN